jgi:uncharacterized repeat protein (TIGR01451 family)
MATINNQATLSYVSGGSTLEVSSNTASITLQGPLTIAKRSLESSYQLNNTVVYTVEFKNTSSAALNNVTVKDDLGTYEVTNQSTTIKVTPLTYVGPAQRFENGTFVGNVTATVDASKQFVTFTIGTIAAGASEILQYKVETNDYAKGAVGSTIKNTASVTATGVNSPVTDDYILTVGNYADVTIEKSMSPDPIMDGSTISYTFVLKNYGNTEATDVTLKDTFAPAPTIDPTKDHTYVDGVQKDEQDYNPATGKYEFPGVASTYQLTVPAATISQDLTTGFVSVVPGVRTVRVDATI